MWNVLHSTVSSQLSLVHSTINGLRGHHDGASVDGLRRRGSIDGLRRGGVDRLRRRHDHRRRGADRLVRVVVHHQHLRLARLDEAVLLPAGRPRREHEEDEGQDREEERDPPEDVGVRVADVGVVHEEGLLVPRLAVVLVEVELVLLDVLVPVEEDHADQDGDAADEAEDAHDDERLQEEHRFGRRPQ